MSAPASPFRAGCWISPSATAVLAPRCGITICTDSAKGDSLFFSSKLQSIPQLCISHSAQIYSTYLAPEVPIQIQSTYIRPRSTEYSVSLSRLRDALHLRRSAFVQPAHPLRSSIICRTHYQPANHCPKSSLTTTNATLACPSSRLSGFTLSNPLVSRYTRLSHLSYTTPRPSIDIRQHHDV